MTSETHPAEPHVGAINTKLNWLRAGVLGANDGIVSVAGIVIGVAAATLARGPIFTAGLVIAAFVSIPIVNLATPLFGMAFMVHMHKRLSGPRPELIEPRRKTGMPVV